MSDHAPRWARALLTRFADPDRADEVVGDLDEAHRLRVERHGRVVAAMWTSLEAIDMARALRRARRSGRHLHGSAPRFLPLSWLDFKLGARMLARYPGLTLVAGLAMAFTVWVGAGTFEIVTQVLYPKIPLEDGDRIVALRLFDTETRESETQLGFDFTIWLDELESVEDLGAYSRSYVNLVVDGDVGDPVVVSAMTASGFHLTRVPPLHGRFVVPADEEDGAPPVAVLSYELWQTRFAGDPAVVGRVIRLGNDQPTVVGVMPEGYGFPMMEDAWVPLRRSALRQEPGLGPGIQIFGRLRPGSSIEQVEAELAAHVAGLASERPDTHAHLVPAVMPFARAWLGVSPQVWTMVSLSMVSFNIIPLLLLLLIAANVALLMFARAAARESEIVVRTALGAGRARIVGQLFAEALVLGGLAAGIGLAATSLGLRWAFTVYRQELFNGEALPYWLHASLSPPTILYAVLLTLVGAALAGVLPALKVTRGLGDGLKERSAGGGGLQLGGVWTAVIVTQVAVTLPIPVVVYALIAERAEFEEATMGVPVEQYLGVRVEIEAPIDDDRPALMSRFASAVGELERRLEADPRVRAVTTSDRLPRTYHPWNQVEVLEGAAAPPDERGHRVGVANVALDFFQTLDAPVLAGRSFGSGDLDPEARVVIVSSSFVERVLGGRNAVGRHVRFIANEGAASPRADEPWHEIVGVVRDLGAGSGYGPQSVYRPLSLATPRVQLLVHAPGNPLELTSALRTAALSVDPALEIHDAVTLADVVRSDLEFYDFWITLVIVVSLLAVVLSLAGIYAAMSFAVSRRTREIGIRVALGARRGEIVRSIFRRPLLQLGAGMTVGALLTLGLMSTSDSAMTLREWVGTSTYVLVMTAITASACVVPTRRALSVEPTEALRSE